MTKNDPLYDALYLIDVNFEWRWLNQAYFFDLISRTTQYSENPLGYKKLFKEKLVIKVLKIGFPCYELSENDIYLFFLKFYTSDRYYISEIIGDISDIFENKFILSKEQILEILDICFMIPNHIVKLNWNSALRLISKIPSGKQQVKRYKILAIVYKTLSLIEKPTFKKSLDFLDIPRTSWNNWQRSTVKGKKNRTRFNEWVEEVKDETIDDLKPYIKKFLIDPTFTSLKIDKDISGFSELFNQ